jgi:hypothetical protein
MTSHERETRFHDALGQLMACVTQHGEGTPLSNAGLQAIAVMQGTFNRFTREIDSLHAKLEAIDPSLREQHTADMSAGQKSERMQREGNFEPFTHPRFPAAPVVQHVASN